MTVLDNFKTELITRHWVSSSGVVEYNNFLADTEFDDVAEVFVSWLGVIDAATFVWGVGGSSAAEFVIRSDAIVAAEFVSIVGLDFATSYVSRHSNVWRPIGGLETVDLVNKFKAVSDAQDPIKVAEKNNAGFALENKNLTGKNLSGLKITSLKGCGYDSSDPPNFSRCDLTGCDMTKLIKLRRWEELFGTNVDEAVAAIEPEDDMSPTEPTFTVTKVEEGSVVTADFLLTRVRVWYNTDTNLVSRVPIVG